MTLPVDPQRLALYFAVVAALCATPGPANLFSIANGAVGGARAVLAAVAGMNAASLVWYAGAAVGLGGLMLAFPAAFHVVTWVGAAYVAWLGLSSLATAARGQVPVAHAAVLRTGSP